MGWRKCCSGPCLLPQLRRTAISSLFLFRSRFSAEEQNLSPELAQSWGKDGSCGLAFPIIFACSCSSLAV